MGKFIVLSENLKQLDPTIKVKLVEHLKQVQQQKQMSRKIHSKVDVIRQLYAQGKFNEAEESYNQEVLTEVDDESSDGISHNSNE
jgi:ABC-type microcin C transport system duplicated ATPase subunit YejF